MLWGLVVVFVGVGMGKIWVIIYCIVYGVDIGVYFLLCVMVVMFMVKVVGELWGWLCVFGVEGVVVCMFYVIVLV